MIHLFRRCGHTASLLFVLLSVSCGERTLTSGDGTTVVTRSAMGGASYVVSFAPIDVSKPGRVHLLIPNPPECRLLCSVSDPSSSVLERPQVGSIQFSAMLRDSASSAVLAEVSGMLSTGTESNTDGDRIMVSKRMGGGVQYSLFWLTLDHDRSYQLCLEWSGADRGINFQLVPELTGPSWGGP